MVPSLKNILPRNFSVTKLNRSRPRLTLLYYLIKKNTTLDNYKTLYDDTFKLLTNYSFQYLFATSYREFVSKNLEHSNIEFIDNDLKKLKYIPTTRRKKLFPSKKEALKKGKIRYDNPISKIYSIPAVNSKAIYNLPRH